MLIDIKNRGQIKLIDFGTAHNFDPVKRKMNAKHGTAYYVAPEVIEASKWHSYNEKCEIWSIGIILYMMLCGRPPWDGRNEQSIIMKIVNGGPVSFRGSLWEMISSEAKNFID